MFPEQLLVALLFNGEESGRKENSPPPPLLPSLAPPQVSRQPAAPAPLLPCPCRLLMLGLLLPHSKILWLLQPCMAPAGSRWLGKGSSRWCGTWAKRCLHCTGGCGHFAGSNTLTQTCSQMSPTGALTGSRWGNLRDVDGLQPPWVWPRLSEAWLRALESVLPPHSHCSAVFVCLSRV